MQLGLRLGSGTASNDIETAKRAETAGFSSVYVYDFFASNALARLGGIAAATEHIRIGSAIANTFTRSPMVLAQGALDIDEISGGRLVLGLGTGLEKMNVEWYGVPYGKPVTRVKEVIALLRQVFATDGLEPDGRARAGTSTSPPTSGPQGRGKRFPCGWPRSTAA